MNRTTFLLVFLMPLLNGCVHVDSVESFLFKGVVFDKSSKCPLDQVEISFVDTGFDSVRSKKMIRMSVGESDNLGRIDAKHDYWWGRNKGIFKKYPPRTFDVVLARESYKETVMHFRATDLIREKDALVVPLGEIYLEPQRE